MDPIILASLISVLGALPTMQQNSNYASEPKRSMVLGHRWRRARSRM